MKVTTIKKRGTLKSQSNFFYLFGEKETDLTKAFAYTLSSNRLLLFAFLRNMGISINNTDKNYEGIEIRIEKPYEEEGRTDIEIVLDVTFHLIIEAKIGTNKILGQYNQYIPILERSQAPVKIMCFISQINEHRKTNTPNVLVKNKNWLHIDRLLEDKTILSDPLVRNFQKYLRRFFKMKTQKEILIQSLGIESEIQKYRSNNIYRRNVIYGSPLYFCPYFSRKSKQPEGEGSHYISRVLGIISSKITDFDAQSIQDELKSFCSDFDENKQNELITKWSDGIDQYISEEQELSKDNKGKDYSFYFLDNPIRLPGKALKDSRNGQGRGKNWIAANIPANRCVSFTDLLQHLTPEK